MTGRESTPLITVVTPLYKSSGCLPRLHASLCAQTFRDFEWVCVDDCSPDGSVAFAAGLADAGAWRNRLYRLPTNSGGTAALGLGIEQAHGRIIACIDHDDELYPDSLQRMIDAWPAVEADERIAGLFFRVFESRSGVVFGEGLADGLRFSMQWLENHHPEVSDGTIAFRAELLKRHGNLEKFDPVALWGVVLADLTAEHVLLLAPGGPVRIYHRDQLQSQTLLVRISEKTVLTYARLLDHWDRTYWRTAPRWLRHGVSMLRFSRAALGSEAAGLTMVQTPWIRAALVALIPLARLIALLKPAPLVVHYEKLDYAAVRRLPDLKAGQPPRS